MVNSLKVRTHGAKFTDYDANKFTCGIVLFTYGCTQLLTIIDCQPKPVPFKDFTSILGFLASIGLAASAPSAFSLMGVTSLFGDSSDDAQARIRQSAMFLTWASAAFIVAIAWVVALQLFYTDDILVETITYPSGDHVKRKFLAACVKHLLGCCAWLALGFQLAGLLLLSQSWVVISHEATLVVRYGFTSSVVIIGGTALLADFASNARAKAIEIFFNDVKKFFR